MEQPFKQYKLNDSVTIQVLSYNEEMTTAQFWFNGKGFDNLDHHHPHHEVNIVLAGEFNATNGMEQQKVFPGQVVSIPAGAVHDMECLSPAGSMITVWTPARKDIIEKYTERA
ncbi:MAG: cupin domain-containing protein [Chitinophagaceae bacterium]|nr:cupin domain-containing protein [Chitinophagaceae bacterium]